MLMFLLLIIACRVSKKEKERLKDSYTWQGSAQSAGWQQWQQQQQGLWLDSGETLYSWWMQPKGTFSMHARQGFTGEAEQLWVLGRQSHKSRVQLQEQIRQDSSWFKQQQNQHKAQHVAKQLWQFKRTRYGIGLCLLLLIGAWCWWKWRH